MCRGPIPDNIKVPKPDRQVFWYYSGSEKGSWWSYDPITDQLIEDAYQRGEARVDVEILGRKYTICFLYRTQTSNGRSRTIRRDPIDQEDVLIGTGGTRHL